MYRNRLWPFTGMMAALALPQPLPAVAQEPISSPTSAVCMRSPLVNDSDGQIMIIVPSPQEQAMLDRGFAAEPCPNDPQGFAQFRAKVCILADAHPSVHEQFSKSFRISPEEACNLATAAIPAD